MKIRSRAAAILCAAIALPAVAQPTGGAAPYPSKPVRVIPELPTLAETVAPGFELGNIYCIFAPAQTPKAILARVNGEVSRIVNSGDVRDKLAADGAQPAPPVSVETFEQTYLREVAKWQQFTRKTKAGG